MSRCNFEFFSLNIEILIEIFQHLDFADQLRLSRVNKFCFNVFVNYVWKETYTTLKLFERIDEFIVCNESDDNRLCLNCEELEEFLKTYASNVNSLILKNTVYDNVDYEEMEELTLGNMIASKQIDMGQFTKLRSLIYHDMKITPQHLELIVNCHPNLEELQLISCWQMGKDIQMLIGNIVPQLKNLRILCTNDRMSYQISYRNFCEIVCKRPQECLRLNATLELDAPEVMRYQPELFGNLEELSIRTWFDQKKWPYNYSLFLKHFENLKILNLQISNNVTHHTLATIAETCKMLYRFALRYTIFQDIDKFVLPTAVEDFSMRGCKGLTQRNLRQILSEFKLKKFKSCNTSFSGDFKAFHLSPSIESLDIDDIVTEKLRCFYENNEDLKALTWYREWFNDEIAMALTLVTCKNLHFLELQECHMSSHTLLQLQSLRKLIMPHPVPVVSWSYIMAVLKHPSLSELCIRPFCRAGYEDINVDMPIERAFNTNLVYLEIPMDVFQVAIEFWLDLFVKNKNLRQIKCTFHATERYDDFLKEVINHMKFPKSLRTISLCGFSIDCHELRKNFQLLLKKLQSYTDGYLYRYYEQTAGILFKKPDSQFYV